MIFHITKPEWEQKSKEITFVDCSKLKRVYDYLMKQDKLGYDSETTGFDRHLDRLFCYQIGTTEHQFVIDHRVVPIEEFKQILESKTLVGVNLKFDLGFLYKQGIYPTSVIDVMLNEICITNGLYSPAYIKANKPYGFKALSKQYLDDEEVDKSIGASFSRKPYDEALYEKEIVYAAKDVINPLLILKEQEPIIHSDFLEPVTELENRFTRALASMEYNGIHLDTEAWKEIKVDVNQLLIKSTEKLTTDLRESKLGYKTIRTGGKSIPLFYEYETQGGELKSVCSIKWSSPDQVKKVFNLLDIDVDSVKKEVLLKMKAEYPFVESYLDYKALDSLKSKFTDTLEEFVNSETENIHTDFWQIVSTGRLSASRPNLQQIPSKGTHGEAMRMSFVANDNEVLVTSDISGAELRIIAEGSQDPLWLKTFIDGKDLHGVIASELFGISPADSKTLDFPLTLGKKYRDLVKTINFGLAYGMTEYKLSNTIGISVEDAKAIIDDYFSKVPKVKEFLDSLGKYTRKHGVAYTYAPIKRPRYFDMDYIRSLPKQEANVMLAAYERAGKNSPIQGTNADWVKLAICNIYDYIQENKFPAKLRLTVHDEIVTSTEKDLGEEWKEIQERLMIEAGKVFIKSIPIVVESHVGHIWSH